ncbi:MAG: ATP-binding protein, partial [Spirochaetes bacterium]|nr:ATP-binding protein [Spirochaetota bacterium]
NFSYLFFQKIIFLSRSIVLFLFIRYFKVMRKKGENIMIKSLIYVLIFLPIILIIFAWNYPVFYLVRQLSSACFLVIVCYVVYFIFYQGLLKKRDTMMIALSGLVIIFFSIYDLVINMYLRLNTPFLSSFGFAVFVISLGLYQTRNFVEHHIELEKLNRSLEDKVEERTNKLKELYQQKSRFIANFTHEIKTPLTLMGNYFHKYIEKHKINNDLKVIGYYLDKLSKDVLNIFDLEKILHNKVIFTHDQIVDLSTYLKETLVFFTDLLQEKKIKLDTQIEEAVYIKADPGALDRIINNLMDNAIKYTSRDSIIQVELGKQGDRIRFVINDQGKGMPIDQQDKLFLPYYQVSNDKAANQGMGLGLCLVKDAVDSLAGQIQIHSQPQKGTKVIVQLPCTDIKDQKIIAQPVHRHVFSVLPVMEIQSSSDNFDTKPLILIVEDNYPMQIFLKEQLLLHYRIKTANNGSEAIKLIKEEHPDLIVSDYVMDNMDGPALLNYLNQHEELQNIPLIFLTANTSLKKQIESLYHGASDYIFKPFHIDLVKARIYSLIQAKIQQQQCFQQLLKNAFHFQAPAGGNPFQHQPDIQHFALQFQLSNKEKEITQLLCSGLQNKEISHQLQISQKTVEWHLHNIYQKTGVYNRTELLHLYHQS